MVNFIMARDLCLCGLCHLCRAMRLDESEAQALLREYTGQRYEIERHMMVINHLTPLSFSSYR